MRKVKKILFVNEASFLASGFGTYGKELLPRLVDDGTFQIAEFGSFATVGDRRDKDIYWRFYPNAVSKDDPRFDEYKSRGTNAFGEWRFERVLLDYLPDCILDIRDPWHFSYECYSPFREFYNWTICPTFDSAPARDEWIEMYSEADGVFTYSDWARKELEKQGCGKINLQGVAPAGVDLEVFKPIENKKEHKKELGFTEDSLIVGFVSRNQRRKLFPDLFEAFRIFLDNAPEDLARRTYLYVHTSYPDAGWPLAELLKEFRLGNKVLFTYICKATKKPFCTFFQDARTYSPFSNSATGVLPSTSEGITREQLADVYNLFDLYIQYSIAEGEGVSQIEAAACGIPIMSVDYSAMSDIVRQTKGIPLKVQRMFREIETFAYRAYPDNKYCADMIEKFLLYPDKKKQKMSEDARKGVKQYYNWDTIANRWLDYFKSVELTGLQGQWDSPMRQYNIPAKVPNNLSNSELTSWLCKNLLNKPEKAYRLLGLDTTLELNYGARVNFKDFSQVTRKDIVDSFKRMASTFVSCERARCGLDNLAEEDYIQYAHMKEKLGGK